MISTDCLPSHRLMVANITDVLEAARTAPETFASSCTWYERYRRRLYRLGHAMGVDTATAVGAFAALSPACDVDRNMALARLMLDTNDCRHPHGNAIEKARRIRNGEDPTDVLRGDKVCSFYANLMRPRDPGPVTIDRHALAIAHKRILEDRYARRVMGRKGGYETVADAYREVGANTGLLPCQVQAVTWEHWRTHHSWYAPNREKVGR